MYVTLYSYTLYMCYSITWSCFIRYRGHYRWRPGCVHSTYR